MSGIKLSQLTLTDYITSSDEFPIVRSGSNYIVSLGTILSSIDIINQRTLDTGTQFVSLYQSVGNNTATLTQQLTSLSGSSYQNLTAINTLSSNGLRYSAGISSLSSTSLQTVTAVNTLNLNSVSLTQQITSVSATSIQQATLINTVSSNGLNYSSRIDRVSSTAYQAITGFSTLNQNYATINQGLTSLSGASTQQASFINTLSSNGLNYSSRIDGLSATATQLVGLTSTLNGNYATLNSQISSLSSLTISTQLLTAVNTLNLNYVSLTQQISSLSSISNSLQLLTAVQTLSSNLLNYSAQLTGLSGETSRQYASFTNTLTANYATTTFVVQSTAGASSLFSDLKNTVDGNYGTLRSSLTDLSGHVTDAVVSLTAKSNEVDLNLQSFGNNFTLVSNNSGGWTAASYAIQKASLPVKVSQLENQSVNSGGGRDNFFILVDGTMRVVGQNASGELGIGSKTTASVNPTMPAFKPPLNALSNTTLGQNRFAGETVKIVRSIGQNAFVVTTEGRVYVSGNNDSQQLARAGITDTNIFTEVPLSTQTWEASSLKMVVTDPVIDIAVGTGIKSTNNVYYALTRGGRIWAWGDNTFGQSGVAGYKNAYYDKNGTLQGQRFKQAYYPDAWQWLSDTIDPNIQFIVRSAMTSGSGTLPNPYGFKTIGGSTYAIPMILPKFGAILDTSSSTFVGGLTAKAIYSSGNLTRQSTYAIDENDNLWVWGDNSCGQLGNGDTVGTTSVYPVSAVTNLDSSRAYKGAPVKKVIAGAGDVSNGQRFVSWLITKDGRVYGAGNNGTSVKDGFYCIGESYNSVNSIYNSNKQIIGWTQLTATNINNCFVDDIVAHVDTSQTTAFALITAGIVPSGAYVGKQSYTLKGWGDNTSGQLGNGFGGTNVVAFIQDINGPWVTGRNNGRTIGTANVLKVAIAGNDALKTTLVLDTLGRLWTAGYGATGLLGDGSTTNTRYTFDRVLLNPNLGNVKDIVSTNNGWTPTVAGYNELTSNFLALLDSGAVVGWGANKGGQLGVGADNNGLPYSDVLVPTLVQIVI
jgi:alpha-tubulin suppressor-like RCC1 family protein